MILSSYFILSLLIFSTKSENFDEFYEYVSDQLNATANWTIQVNNEKLYAGNNAKITNSGCWDFIIIGGGSAGSLLAGRLSEISKWNILLLEAGDNQTEFSDILGFSNSLARSEMNWNYFTSPQKTVCQGMVDNKCVYPRGKVLGGCAVINAVMNARGIPQDYNEWAALGNPGWSFSEVLPYFKSFETVDFPNADPYYYGHNGRIHVNYTHPPSLVADAFLKANMENGLPQIDYNGKDIQGVSRIQFQIKGNKRDNSAHAYLDPARDRPNLKIILKAFVTKILVNKKEAYGVEFLKDGKRYHAAAKNEVILSAGSINSPQILLLSGIGPAGELSLKGIPPKVNLPAVGKHLKDHPMFINLYFRTNLSAPILSLKENLERFVDGETPLTNGAYLEQLGFINTKKNSPYLRDIEFITTPPPDSVPGNPNYAFNLNDDYVKAFSEYNTSTDMLVLVALLKSKSEGSVTLKSRKALDFPVIDVNFFSDKKNEDIETMYQGIRYVLSLMKTPAFKRINATYISTQPGCEDLRKEDVRKYWYCAIRHATSTIYHPVGTTRMGNSSLTSVVNTDLKVHKMKNLRVIDAGVMPTQISGHTNSPTYMIAEKMSHKIKSEYGVV